MSEEQSAAQFEADIRKKTVRIKEAKEEKGQLDLELANLEEEGNERAENRNRLVERISQVL